MVRAAKLAGNGNVETNGNVEFWQGLEGPNVPHVWLPVMRTP